MTGLKHHGHLLFQVYQNKLAPPTFSMYLSETRWPMVAVTSHASACLDLAS